MWLGPEKNLDGETKEIFNGRIPQRYTDSQKVWQRRSSRELHVTTRRKMQIEDAGNTELEGLEGEWGSLKDLA